MSCTHLAESVRNVGPGVPVHKEECSFCFHGVDLANPDILQANPNGQVSTLLATKQNYPKTGHNVCLLCFTGGCFTPYGHMFRHYEATKHHVVLNIEKKVTPSLRTTIDTTTIKSLDELAAHVSKQSDDIIEHIYTAYCITCDELLPVNDSTPLLYASLQSIISTDSGLKLQHFAAQQDASSGTLGGLDIPTKTCAHTIELDANHDEICAVNLSLQAFPDDMNDNTPSLQPSHRPFIQIEVNPNRKIFLGENFLPDLSTAAKPLSEAEIDYHNKKNGIGCYNIYQCQNCDINKNLWLCMTCGFLGCARRDYDGSGGNNHAVQHSEETGHPLVIKIATVTKDSGDIWCYSCNDAVQDDQLSSHLSVFNLDSNKLLKSEQSLEDMQLQLNITAQFASAYSKDGVSPLIFGPLYTGMQNFGNSCYLASVLQLYFRIPAIYNRYYIQGLDHVKTCRNGRPGTCMFCNLYKITCGLFSGDYSQVPSQSRILQYMKHIFPSLLQNLQNQQALAHSSSSSSSSSSSTVNSSLHPHPSMALDDDGSPQLLKRFSDDADQTSFTKKQRTDNDGHDVDQSNVLLDSSTLPIPVIGNNNQADKLQNGITVHSIRKLLCNNHVVFGNHQQQDAHEFLCHLRDFLHTFESSSRVPEAVKLSSFTSFQNEPTNSLVIKNINDPLGYRTQQTITCTSCNHIGYKFGTNFDLGLELTNGMIIPDDEMSVKDKEDPNISKERYDIAQCLNAFSTPRPLTGYRCPNCKEISTSISTSTFLTLPQHLTIQVRRFIIDQTTWSLKKNNGKLLGTDLIDLSPLLSTIAPDMSIITAAANEGNTGATNSTANSENAKYTEKALEIAEMCYTPICRAIAALKRTNNDANAALELLFDAEDCTQHIPSCSCPGATTLPPPTTVSKIVPADPAYATVGTLDMPLFSTNDRNAFIFKHGIKYRLVGFINHLGSTPQSGHYVSHINSAFNQQLSLIQQSNPNQATVINPTAYSNLTPPHSINDISPCIQSFPQQITPAAAPQWVCYNDAKVFINNEPPADDAYILLYQRVD